MSKQIEELAIQMHLWYLQATAKLRPESYNPEAQKAYTELTEQQKDIDRYIAGKVLALKQQWQLEAEQRLFEGGEKKFIKMLLDNGTVLVEQPEDFQYNAVTIKIPKKTVRKYFDGELTQSDKDQS